MTMAHKGVLSTACKTADVPHTPRLISPTISAIAIAIANARMGSIAMAPTKLTRVSSRSRGSRRRRFHQSETFGCAGSRPRRSNVSGGCWSRSRLCARHKLTRQNARLRVATTAASVPNCIHTDNLAAPCYRRLEITVRAFSRHERLRTCAIRLATGKSGCRP
jgi:hypothetical protein